MLVHAHMETIYACMMYVHKLDILHNKCGTKYRKQGIELLRRQIEREREREPKNEAASYKQCLTWCAANFHNN